jgi:hypothetical protein
MESNTLKKLGLEDRDISRIANSPNNNKINNDSISTFVLGTMINTIDSTFVNTPIFNLKTLDDDGLLDLNAQSASQDDMSILMTSNKKAACNSNVFSVDAKVAANIGGIIGGSASAHYDQSMSLANSDGNIYVAMQRGKHGSYYQILISDFKAGLDLTPYLIGKELTTSEIEKYVSYKQVSSEGKQYINELAFGGYDESGLIKWSERKYYENVQLLTRMEEIFAILLDQYATFKDNEKIKNILYANMVKLKFEKISHAVKDFYSHVGTHFVSKLKFSNYAYGYGTLNFSESSGNQESRLGVATSISGGIPTKTSGEASTEVSYAQKNGWAGAMKNLSIKASSRPAGVVNIESFATNIMNILNAEGKPLSVPNLDVPKSPKVELLAKPEVKKKSVGPPDSVFSSYKDWKDYQDDLKKDEKGKDKTHEVIEKTAKEITSKGYVDIELQEFHSNGQNNDKINNNKYLYETFKQELYELKANRKLNDCSDSQFIDDNGNAADESSLLRINDMFVSGYEVAPYELVIPSLRTNKLILPERKEDIDSYPNASKLFLVINLFNQLADYTKFISNYSVSNISEKFFANIEKFVAKFSEEGYDLITKWMVVGTDIPADLLHGFEAKMYFDQESILFICLEEDPDKVNYIKYLLKPEVMYLWRDAPGGYAPFCVDNNQNISFVAPSKSSSKHETCGESGAQYYPAHIGTYYDLSKQITETPDDMSQLYKDSSASPLYPIFRYESKNNPKFLFLQLIGRYQFIYGRNAQIKPCIFDGPHSIRTFSLKENVFSNNFTIYDVMYDIFPVMEKSTTDLLLPHVEGFNIDKIDQNYAIFYPSKTQTKTLREQNKVIQIGDQLNVNEHQPTVQSTLIRKPVNKECFYWVAYAVENLFYSTIKEKEGQAAYIVKIEDGSKKPVSDPEKFPLLMPIDYSKITGDGCLLMGNSFGARNLINSPTYDAAVIASIH